MKAIPLPGKKNIKGEDAYFCAPKYYIVLNNRILVVADGVGGWNESGIDPSKYSNSLCNK